LINFKPIGKAFPKLLQAHLEILR